ncbi:MATE family efflux transporter [Enterococcus cecorum]|uniref:MATE family efflux transporter n=1 Tax=Enterococcus cecorum TaxID=44008 RepID=UPI00263F7905|nr:MATE family efflux transporter [Enterococcus cecorum]
MAILQAFGFMCGHGSGSWISRLLGAREIERARQYSTTGFAMAFLMGIFFLFLGLWLITPLMCFCKRPITRYIENLQSPLIFSTYSG